MKVRKSVWSDQRPKIRKRNTVCRLRSVKVKRALFPLINLTLTRTHRYNPCTCWCTTQIYQTIHALVSVPPLFTKHSTHLLMYHQILLNSPRTVVVPPLFTKQSTHLLVYHPYLPNSPHTCWCTTLIYQTVHTLVGVPPKFTKQSTHLFVYHPNLPNDSRTCWCTTQIYQTVHALVGVPPLYTKLSHKASLQSTHLLVYHPAPPRSLPQRQPTE